MDLLRVSVSAAGHEEPCPVVTLAGELDVTTGGQLCSALMMQASRGARRLVVDLAGLGFSDVAGARILWQVHQMLQERGGGLALVAPQPIVARVLRLTGAGQMIPVYDSVGKAAAG